MIIFGQDSAIGRFFYDYEDFETRREVVSQSLMIQIAVCLAAVAILILLSDSIAQLVSTAESSKKYFNIILVQVPFTLAVNFSQNLLKWTFSRNKFLVMSIGYSVAQAIGLLATIFFFQVDVEAVLFLSLIINIIFGVLGLFMVRSWLLLPKCLDFTGDLLRFAFPIGMICLLGAAIPMLERQWVEKLLSLEGLGLYAAGSKLAMLLTVVTGSFQTAWGPFSTAIHRESDAAETYNFVLGFFALLVCLLTMLLDSISKPLLVMLASQRYADATIVVFPLAMATAVQSISWVTEIGISLSKKTFRSIYPHLIYIAIIIVSMPLIVPFMGLVGAALSMLVAQIFRSVIASWLAQRVYSLPWTYGWVLGVVFCTLSTGFLAHGILEPRFGSWTIGPLYLLVGVSLCIYFWQKYVTKSAKTHLAHILFSREK
jgi:O-antigen/teichoic acid export membrane protein